MVTKRTFVSDVLHIEVILKRGCRGRGRPAGGFFFGEGVCLGEWGEEGEVEVVTLKRSLRH